MASTDEPTADPFAPATLGRFACATGVVKAATSEGRSPDGLVTDDLIDFHRRFAAGGVGMTTVAYCCVTRDGASAWPDRHGRAGGTRPARGWPTRYTGTARPSPPSSGHAGVVANKKLIGKTPMAPSRFVNPASSTTCGSAATDRSGDRPVRQRRGIAVAAGFDAVELHFGHLYLPSSFLAR